MATSKNKSMKTICDELIDIICEQFGVKPQEEPQEESYTVIHLEPNFYVDFKNELWNNRGYYSIVVYNDNKSIFELALSRIQASKDENTKMTQYTWPVRQPSKAENIKAFDKTLGVKVEGKRYLLCKDAGIDTLKKQFIEVLVSVLRQHGFNPQIKHESKPTNADESSDESFNDDEGTIEGQLQDYTTTRLTRNRDIVKQRKEYDKYTCQACKFTLLINGVHIIDCHHTQPLNTGERITTIDDLVCLCPICHRIAHTRKDRPLTVEEIKTAIKTGSQAVAPDNPKSTRRK